MRFEQFHVEFRQETVRVRLVVKRLAQGLCHLCNIRWLDAPQPSATLSRHINLDTRQDNGKFVHSHGDFLIPAHTCILHQHISGFDHTPAGLIPSTRRRSPGNPMEGEDGTPGKFSLCLGDQLLTPPASRNA